MKKSNHQHSLSPDETTLSILKKKSNFIESLNRINSNHNHSLSCKSKPLKPIFNSSGTNLFKPTDVYVSTEYKSVEELISQFNEVYVTYGKFISNYFENELLNIYNTIFTIYKHFTQTIIHYARWDDNHSENLKIFVLTLKRTLETFYELFKAAQDKEEQIRLELQRQREHDELIIREQELSKIRTHIDDETESYLPTSDDSSNSSCSIDEEIDPQYRNNIQKVVNHICSQITCHNPTHSLGRLRDLIKLFGMEDIPLVGCQNKWINLCEHEDAVNLCWKYFKQAILSQCQSQFAKNVDSVVTFASLLSAVLGAFPDRMEFLVQALCDRFITLVQDVEDRDNMIDELRGVSRLLAALYVARPPPGYEAHVDLCPANLWLLLARIANGDINPSVTSEACVCLLEIGGITLRMTYGSQFNKLLLALKQKFERCHGMSELSVGLLIDNGLTKGTFEHRGYLEANFWK